MVDKEAVLNAIRNLAETLGHTPSRSEFRAKTGMTEYAVFKHFPSWREAVRAAGVDSRPTNVRLSDEELLRSWGCFVRKERQIPTRRRYRVEGEYSPGVFERHFGPWSAVPERFRRFAEGKPEWADVLALLPLPRLPGTRTATPASAVNTITSPPRPQHSKLDGRPTYGNPIDFRGLRHEPVNEQGVVFIFGMVARELGYMVEAVQAGFPDCEAKRQVAPGKWQRVRIEFEFESRSFRDHGHSPEGCDVIVCWIHNWTDCPSHLEVLELSSVIRSLAQSEE